MGKPRLASYLKYLIVLYIYLHVFCLGFFFLVGGGYQFIVVIQIANCKLPYLARFTIVYNI